MQHADSNESVQPQSQGSTLEEAIANIKEAIELYLDTLPIGERDVLLSREILTTAVEVNA